MTFLRHTVRFLKLLVLGSKLQRAADRNNEAADRLDAALRKVLRK